MQPIHITSLFLLLIYWTGAVSDPLAVQDIKWLNRMGYGITSQAVAEFQSQGKKKYLEGQLAASADDNLPPSIQSLVAQLSIEQKDEEWVAKEFHNRHKGLKNLPTEQRQIARKARNQAAEQVLNETRQRHLLRALYSPWQLKQQMTWFWLNHFSVFSRKGNISVLLADYEDTAIRPHVLGKFRDLLMASLRHPAMLVYLDNSHNAVAKINENYARELMELHTLGVDGGYTQQDVQNLAKILTGVGINWEEKKPKMKPELRRYYVRDGIFEFNPKRHDFSEKHFLGKTIKGEGFAEVEQVVDLLAKHPSTAKFISRKLAVYLVSDHPTPALVEKVAKTFTATDGDIAACLRTLLESQEFADSLGKKVSDPMHYILATVRFVYDGDTITDIGRINQWLNKLDEPLYGHSTPDGYGMTEKDWISPAQLTERFEVAKQIANSKLSASRNAALVRQKLADKPLFKTLEPLLSAQTKAALEKAKSAQEWNTFLLSAPEFMYR